jgi:hypothetical protein
VVEAKFKNEANAVLRYSFFRIHHPSPGMNICGLSEELPGVLQRTHDMKDSIPQANRLAPPLKNQRVAYLPDLKYLTTARSHCFIR